MAPIKLFVSMMCVWGFRAMQLAPEHLQHPHGMQHGTRKRRQHPHGMHHGTSQRRHREIHEEMNSEDYYDYLNTYYGWWYYYWFYPERGDYCTGENCWDICGRSYTSNLGGLGPDHGEEQAIRFSKVLRQNGVDIDLVITNTSEYKASEVRMNRADCLLQINVKSGTNVWLNFGFVESNTNVSVVVDKPHLSVMDVDGSKRGKQTVETVFFQNASSTVVYAEAWWTIRHADGGTYYTADTTKDWWGPVENPPLSIAPDYLVSGTYDAAYCAVEAEYRGVSDMVINLNVTLGATWERACGHRKCGSRTFIFSTKMDLYKLWFYSW